MIVVSGCRWLTFTVTGSCRISRPACPTSGGMVAENSRVWRLAGTYVSMPAHIGQEAHVKHAVGLVQHQHFQAGQARGCAA